MRGGGGERIGEKLKNIERPLAPKQSDAQGVGEPRALAARPAWATTTIAALVNLLWLTTPPSTAGMSFLKVMNLFSYSLTGAESQKPLRSGTCFFTTRRTSIARSVKSRFSFARRTAGDVTPSRLPTLLVMMDHVKANSLLHDSLLGERELVVIADLAIGHTDAEPVGPWTAECAMMALTHPLEHDRPREFYIDRALELIAAISG